MKQPGLERILAAEEERRERLYRHALRARCTLFEVLR